ncbi:MAG: F0F1 ATP synthase subunit delta, partial [Candidatus Cloacimonetes bacterium]|nr:F0F1 ATP synthase subunit delta [Candidatus Cloacimonadota bacterium]
MKNKLIAQRYARAIIGNIDEKLFASAINDISSLKKIFLQFSEITKKIDSYLYPFIERKKIAGEIAKELENKKLWKNLFELLVQKHKFSIIPDILIELENMILEINNQVKVTLKIAHELSDDAIERIESV